MLFRQLSRRFRKPLPRPHLVPVPGARTDADAHRAGPDVLCAEEPFNRRGDIGGEKNLGSPPVVLDPPRGDGFEIPGCDVRRPSPPVVDVQFEVDEERPCELPFVDARHLHGPGREITAPYAVVDVYNEVVPGGYDRAAESDEVPERPPARKLYHMRDMRIESHEVGILRLHEKVDLAVRVTPVKCAHERRREDDVADGT